MEKFETLNDLISHYKSEDCDLIFQSFNTLILDRNIELTKIHFVGSVEGYQVSQINVYRRTDKNDV